jgi:hypothetical protein
MFQTPEFAGRVAQEHAQQRATGSKEYTNYDIGGMLIELVRKHWTNAIFP